MQLNILNTKNLFLENKGIKIFENSPTANKAFGTFDLETLIIKGENNINSSVVYSVGF